MARKRAPLIGLDCSTAEGIVFWVSLVALPILLLALLVLVANRLADTSR